MTYAQFGPAFSVSILTGCFADDKIQDIFLEDCMHIGLIIFLIIVIILWAFVKNKLQDDSENEMQNDSMKSQGSVDDEKYIEMEEMFYEEMKNGKKAYNLISAFNQFDLMFVKSLFQSEQIPYYIESEHASRIRPGMQIGSFGSANVYILDEDYNDAVKIVEEYRNNKTKNYKEKITIRKPVEVLVGAWPVPEAGDSNGIVLKYKK
jgi:hypothetical protein